MAGVGRCDVVAGEEKKVGSCGWKWYKVCKPAARDLATPPSMPDSDTCWKVRRCCPAHSSPWASCLSRSPAPQRRQDSHSSPDTHSHDYAQTSPSGTNYGDYLAVHPYVNAAASDWAAGKVEEYPVQFCNSSETTLIKHGLREAEILAAHARDHIHRWGNSSSFSKKYFGLAATAEAAGWFDKIVNTDKTGVIFRCDDPDGLCAANESTSVPYPAPHKR